MRTSRGNCPSATQDTTNLTWLHPGPNLGLCSRKLVTNPPDLRHGHKQKPYALFKTVLFLYIHICHLCTQVMSILIKCLAFPTSKLMLIIQVFIDYHSSHPGKSFITGNSQKSGVYGD